jgi:hypothetical protein
VTAVAAAAVLWLLAAPPAPGEPEGRPSPFAFIVGVNDGGALGLPSLRYADDDAARYFDLFRLLGARTYLLMRPDMNTSRLHAQAAADAVEPTRAHFTVQLQQLHRDVAAAQQRGARPVVYFVYSGHGHVRDGRGVIGLEDAALSGAELNDQLIRPLKAEKIHLIIDACHSYFLAYSRGPGGTRRALSVTGGAPELARDERVGLLLSTSSARESHEWEKFQAGVFAHEVRSGLMGAADIDGDNTVTYREIAAFITHANEAIPNERFRPDVHARPPKGSDRLVDLREALARRVEVDGTRAGHYLLENTDGVRLAEFHSAPGQPVHLVRSVARPLFLRLLAGERDFRIPTGVDVVSAGDLVAEASAVGDRGSAGEAFSRVFALPLTRDYVERYHFPELPTEVPDVRLPGDELKTAPGLLGWGGAAMGVASVAVAGVAALQAKLEQDSITDITSQEEVARRSQRIRDLNLTTGISLGVAAVSAAVGGYFLHATYSQAAPTVAVFPGGGAVGIAGSW